MSAANVKHLPSILCIDDDPDSLNYLKTVLTPLSRAVLLARDVKDGLRIAQANVPDLIILDIRMPGLNGYQVLNELKKRNLDSVPVIILTADGSTENLLRGYREGCVYFISKPINRLYLANIIQYLFAELTQEEKQKLELQL